MMEQRSESVMTSSSISYQSSGFYPSDYNRPRSGGSKSPLSAGVVGKNPLDDAVIREMSSKMSERHEESNQTFVTQEQKWEYMGQGIWENGHNNATPKERKKPMDTLNMATSYHQSSRHKASSATQELDDLMQSLNTFKIGGKIDEPISTNLDMDLKNLQTIMDKEGVKTTQKGECFACNKPIVGQVVTALGKTFHPEHFTCAHCNMVCRVCNVGKNKNTNPQCQPQEKRGPNIF